MIRPTVQRVRRYNWLHRDQQTPGIALMGEHGIIAHMTATEALQVATDIADTLEHINATERHTND